MTSRSNPAPSQRRGIYRALGKRLLDLMLATFLFVLLSPLLVLVALAVLGLLGAPVLFRQTRPGLRGEPFSIFKFRTMCGTRDDAGALLPDEKRLGRFGRFLRASSLDELPELWNVIRGDMSLVGPRPLLVEYLERYDPQQARRHEVRPGITGWAQVHGRNLLSWEEKFERDVWYVDHLSFGLDLKILASTVAKVFRGDAISAQGHATMPKFRGTTHE